MILARATDRLVGLGPETARDGARRMLGAAFRAADLPAADLDARVLVCVALGIDHADLVRDPDLPLGAAAESLRALARRRLAREPVSRITGVREFFGMRLEIDPHVLDPRPDTETLVEAVAHALAHRRAEALAILDLGVGSGAILCGLLSSFSGAYGVGVDRSAGACAVARRNLVATGLADRAAILRGNWTDALRGPFDVVVANPPYIPSSEVQYLEAEVREHDPRLALDGGADGLTAYRAIVSGLEGCLVGSGLVAFEIGATQAACVSAILDMAGFAVERPVADLAGRDRVVLARRCAGGGAHDVRTVRKGTTSVAGPG